VGCLTDVDKNQVRFKDIEMKDMKEKLRYASLPLTQPANNYQQQDVFRRRAIY
jgi:hypothetical protein